MHPLTKDITDVTPLQREEKSVTENSSLSPISLHGYNCAAVMTFEFMTLIFMPPAIGLLAAATRRVSRPLFWSVALVIATATLSLVVAARGHPNPEFLPALIVGASLYALPTLGAFGVARQNFFRSRPVAAGIAATIGYFLVGLIAVSGALTMGIVKS